ncbi:MAG TPA: GNAT family N-acetyltransferase [Pyrinomonadaceae bacterium]|nr:GNAT family N-acetyltransferase [Pyrinomonadaceae bacterium]
MSVVRAYEDRDAADMEACFVELQEFERRLDPLLVEGASVARRYLEYMFARSAETGGAVFVAEEDGRAVGFVSVRAKVKSRGIEEREHEYAYVSDLVVLHAYRGRGLGRELLRRAEEHARAAGAKILRLGVLAANEQARGLYRASGFEDRVVEMTKTL